jgi:CBS domain-containing protein
LENQVRFLLEKRRNMAHEREREAGHRHPILALCLARADGTAHRRLRVYCEGREQSVPVEICRACPRCLDIAEDEAASSGWVRCSPPPRRSDPGYGPLVGEALRDGVVAVEEDVPVRDVVAMFVKHRLRLVVVVDAGGHVSGVVHESNLLPHINAHNRGHLPLDAHLEWTRVVHSAVSEVMSSARSISEVVSLREALAEMAAARHQRLVAVNGDGLPTGILVDVYALQALRAASADPVASREDEAP